MLRGYDIVSGLQHFFSIKKIITITYRHMLYLSITPNYCTGRGIFARTTTNQSTGGDHEKTKNRRKHIVVNRELQRTLTIQRPGVDRF